MSEAISRQLDRIFKPRTMAVIGASADPRKWGQWMVDRPMRSGYRGTIYPVNPKEKEILGLKVYPAVTDIADEIDLAVIAVPAQAVPAVMRECARQGVKTAIIISGGFAEVSPAGRSYQEEVAQIAKEAGIRFLGPNCMAIWSSAASLCLAFPRAPKPGPVAFVSQSGGLGGLFSQVASSKGYGLSKFISIGNQADLNVADFMEYLAEDPDTRAIVLYMEGFPEGRRFFEAAKSVVRRKPILIYKAGRTATGSRATLSHTASLTGADQVFDALCRQVGLIRTHEIFHPFDMAEALSSQPLPRGNRIAVVSVGGGQGVILADFCAYLGLELPEFDEATSADLQSALGAHVPPPKNPVDLGGAAETPQRFADILEKVAAVDYIDGIIASQPSAGFVNLGTAQMARAAVDAGEAIAAIPQKYGKPLILGATRWASRGLVIDIIRKAGIPIYETPEDCARAMLGLVRYGEVRRRT